MMAETLEQGQVDIQVQGQEDIQVYGPILGHFLCRLGGTMRDREVTLEAVREGDIFTGRPLTVEGKYRYFLIQTGQKLDSSCAGVNEGETDSTIYQRQKLDSSCSGVNEGETDSTIYQSLQPPEK